MSASEIHSVGPYILGKSLGSGTTGKVKLAFHKDTGAKVAIKIVQKNYLLTHVTMLKKLEREIAVMKVIDHPNILKIYDVYETSKYLFMVLEYAEGGELFDYLVKKGRLTEDEGRNFFQQIISGIDYCHSNFICHRDLKPENLLLTSDKRIKIADFGMASLSQKGQLLKTSCGSPHYASPEVVMGLKYDGRLADIWSCGVILFALLTGKLPFDDDNIRQLLAKVKSGIFSVPAFLSKESKDLIQRMLVVDPSKRISLDEIKTHVWLIGNNADFFKSQSAVALNSFDVITTPDEELVRSLHSLGLGALENVQRALREQRPNLEKAFYQVLNSRKSNPPLPNPANPMYSLQRNKHSSSTGSLERTSPMAIPGTQPGTSASPLASPVVPSSAPLPSALSSSLERTLGISDGKGFNTPPSAGARNIRRRVSMSFGGNANPFSNSNPFSSVNNPFTGTSPLTEQVVGSTPRQSWFSSFFSEIEVEQPQHKREGIMTQKTLENILGELEGLFLQHRIRWESVNNRQIRAYYQGETIGNQASFLVEVLNNGDNDDLFINFTQEAGSERTFNQLCRSFEETLAKNLSDAEPINQVPVQTPQQQTQTQPQQPQPPQQQQLPQQTPTQTNPNSNNNNNDVNMDEVQFG